MLKSSKKADSRRQSSLAPHGHSQWLLFLFLFDFLAVLNFYMTLGGEEGRIGRNANGKPILIVDLVISQLLFSTPLCLVFNETFSHSGL